MKKTKERSTIRTNCIAKFGEKKHVAAPPFKVKNAKKMMTKVFLDFFQLLLRLKKKVKKMQSMIIILLCMYVCIEVSLYGVPKGLGVVVIFFAFFT